MHIYNKNIFYKIVTLESLSIFIGEIITNITNSLFIFQRRTDKNEQPIL